MNNEQCTVDKESLFIPRIRLCDAKHRNCF